MISYLLQLKKEDKPTKENTINSILFVLITIICMVFTIGTFKSNTSTENGYQEGFYPTLKYYPGKIPPAYISIPVILIFIALTVVLLYRLKDKIKENKFAIFLFLFFIFFRFVSVITFPYGKIEYTYKSFIDGSLNTVTYSGFTFYERMITFLYDFCFYFYFLVFFHIYKIIVKENRFFFNLLFVLFQLFVVFMIVYSLIKERNEYVNNFQFLFLNRGKHFLPITSFLTNKNTFGFFLMVGLIFAIVDFIYHENVFSLFMIILFTIVDVFIISKTTLFLILTMDLLFILLYPLFNFKRKKNWSIFFLFVIFTLVIFLLLIVTVFKEMFFEKLLPKFDDILFRLDTIYSRQDITKAGMTMMNNPYYVIFGYSKSPFITIFSDYNELLPIDHHVKFSLHNVYADIFIQYGLIGCLSCIIFICKIIYNLLTKLIFYNKFDNIVYLILLGIIFIYIYFEPRFIFAENAACDIFVLMLMLPYTKKKEKDRPSFLEAV